MTLEVRSRRPDGVARPTPLLFVHGAYVGAWCWDEYFLPWFARRGYAAHAVSLRGHGASAGREGLDLAGVGDYVEDVVAAAAALERPPILIGHSMGAIVVQRAARRVGAPAIALMAPVPPHGLASSVMSLALRDPPLFFALNTLQADGGSGAALGRLRDYLFSASLTEAQAAGFMRRSQRESQRALAELAWPQHLWIGGSVGLPALVMGASDDALFPPAMVAETALLHGVSPVMLADMAHAMMLEPGWRAAAEILDAWLAAEEAAGPAATG